MTFLYCACGLRPSLTSIGLLKYEAMTKQKPASRESPSGFLRVMFLRFHPSHSMCTPGYNTTYFQAEVCLHTCTTAYVIIKLSSHKGRRSHNRGKKVRKYSLSHMNLYLHMYVRMHVH